jgi:hypothetical protein
VITDSDSKYTMVKAAADGNLQHEERSFHRSTGLVKMSNRNENSIRRREDADLSVLRAAFQSRSPEAAYTALQQFLGQPDERILHQTILVTSRQQTTDDDSASADQIVCQGRFVVTNERVIFWSDNNADGDLVVPAECIDLHALSCGDSNDDTTEQEESRTSLYLQIRSDSDRLDSDLIEWTVLPQEQATDDHQAATQALFDALSELISLHPIDPNGDMDDEGEDEMIVAPPSRYDDREATLEERQAMLERLDRLLVIPAELDDSEAVEGQFDDAEADEDEGQFDDADDDDIDALL